MIRTTHSLERLPGRFDRGPVAAPVVLALMVLTPLTWARSDQWSSDRLLFQKDYDEGIRTSRLLRLLTAAHLRERQVGRVAKICDENRKRAQTSGSLSGHCATAYRYTGRGEDAVESYLTSLRRLHDPAPVSRGTGEVEGGPDAPRAGLGIAASLPGRAGAEGPSRPGLGSCR